MLTTAPFSRPFMPAPTGPRRAFAFLLHGFEAGGAQRRVITLAGALARRGLAIDLLVVRGDGPMRAELDPAVRVVEVGGQANRIPAVAASRSGRMAGAIPAVAAYLQRERPCLLLGAANHSALAAVLAHRIAGDPGIALVVRVSNALVGNRDALVPRLRRWAVRQTYGAVDAVIAVSTDLAAEMAALLPAITDRLHVVPNPVVDASVLARAAHAPSHPWFGDNGPPVVLGVGRLVAQKDFPTLLRAVAGLRRRRPVRLIILGDGPARPGLTALAREVGLGADALSMPGFDPNPYSAMARAAAFALSSRWEGMPGALIEAMACNCPVVSTDCPGGSREALMGGALGPLVPVGDPAALADALDGLLERGADRTALRTRAAAFSVDAAVEGYLAVFRTALDRASARRAAVSRTAAA